MSGHTAQNPDKTTRGPERMAHRLANAYAERLMYSQGRWHVWDGEQWTQDERAVVENALFALLRASSAEAKANGDDLLLTDVNKCQSAASIRHVLKLASGLPQLRAADQSGKKPRYVDVGALLDSAEYQRAHRKERGQA